jgi:hypothetical protein
MLYVFSRKGTDIDKSICVEIGTSSKDISLTPESAGHPGQSKKRARKGLDKPKK